VAGVDAPQRDAARTGLAGGREPGLRMSAIDGYYCHMLILYRSRPTAHKALLLALCSVPMGCGAADPGGPTSNPSPTLVSASPSRIQVGSLGVTISLIGSGFVPQSQVLWKGQGRTTTFHSATSLDVAIPASDLTEAATLHCSASSACDAGSAGLVVSNPAPGGGTSDSVAVAFFYPTPTITSISPDSAFAAGPGLTVRIVGTGFYASTHPTFTGPPLNVIPSDIFVSATELDASIPADYVMTPGAHTLGVSGIGVASNTVQFFVVKAP
jgi:trimeric autotransporter adhesin